MIENVIYIAKNVPIVKNFLKQLFNETIDHQ